ncbi:chromate transporter [Deinococcus hopiensis]|uniref:Chromate transporter n=1 Tax=Deinococcus hopiensis KR-140 TaxID=695939 RepID=A0A1W1VER8_9DEIO|nr:chromate transporter [Deinococcus hopiensis]SMB91917.1 chromate transporter [Deinococcus hopiensis KR-140]
MTDLTDLLLAFVRLGLISFGGANVAEIERSLVLEHSWISSQTMASGFALGQIMPGPNLLAVTHYGYAIAGLPGAMTATLGFYGPTALLSAGAALLWQRHSGHPWAAAFRSALLPFGGGVVLASAVVLARGTVTSWPTALLVGLAFTALWRTEANSALVVLLAAVLGALLKL